MTRVARLVALGCLVAVSCFAASCDERREEAVEETGQRIVSLSPSLTGILVDLGVGDRVVGVASADPFAPPGSARLGAVDTLDVSRLVALEPTHVVTSDLAAARVLEAAPGTLWRQGFFRMERVDEVLSLLWDPTPGSTEATLGRVLGLPLRAEVLASRVRASLIRLGRLLESRRVGPVVLVESVEPLLAIPPGTYLGDLLTLAGGENGLEDSGEPRATLDPGDLRALEPRWIFLVVEEERAESALAALRRTLDEREDRGTTAPRLVALTDAAARHPSTAMVRIAAWLARILHPDQTARIDELTRTADLGNLLESPQGER